MNIALFLPNWIGDAVMATPAVRAVRAHLPQAHITGICKPYVAGVFEGAPWLDEMVYLDQRGPWAQRWPAVAWRLRRKRAEVAVLFPNSFRSALVARLAGCQRRIGFRRYLRGWLLTDRLEPLRDERGAYRPTPILDDYNKLAEAAGCSPPGNRMELFATPPDEEAAERIWEECGFTETAPVIALNPGAAFGAAKCWPADSFARLAQELSDRRGCQVLVLCGPGERDIARQITRLAARRSVQSVAESTLSVGLTKALLRRSTLLVTTDSGPRHIAAAFDRPVVTLFGPTHIAWTETHYTKAVHLQKQVPCGPCQLRVCPLDHRCMRELTPAEVCVAVEGLLERAWPERKAS